jgi:hypothetical protein
MGPAASRSSSLRASQDASDVSGGATFVRVLSPAAAGSGRGRVPVWPGAPRARPPRLVPARAVPPGRSRHPAAMLLVQGDRVHDCEPDAPSWGESTRERQDRPDFWRERPPSPSARVRIALGTRSIVRIARRLITCRRAARRCICVGLIPAQRSAGGWLPPTVSAGVRLERPISSPLCLPPPGRTSGLPW